jgi:hypothetical protein
MRLHSAETEVIINGARLNFLPTLDRMVTIFVHVDSRGVMGNADPATSMATARIHETCGEDLVVESLEVKGIWLSCG